MTWMAYGVVALAWVWDYLMAGFFVTIGVVGALLMMTPIVLMVMFVIGSFITDRRVLQLNIDALRKG